MIQEALRRLRIDNPRFVEIGSGDGTENCTRGLLELGGTGIWIEGDPANVRRSKELVFQHQVKVIEQFVTLENIVSLLDSALTEKNIDLLVVDIDGNDWWICQQILSRWRPRLAVTEYNPLFSSTRRWVMPYDEHHVWQHDTHYGASLRSYERLFMKMGYRLVACDSSGVNAFWVQEEDAILFGNPGRGARHHFVRPLPGQQHRTAGEPTVDEAMTDAELEKIKVAGYFRLDDKKSTWKLHVARIVNRSEKAINSFGEHPIRIGACKSAERALSFEPTRFHIEHTIFPGHSGYALYASRDEERFDLFAVVQEGNKWSMWRKAS